MIQRRPFLEHTVFVDSISSTICREVSYGDSGEIFLAPIDIDLVWVPARSVSTLQLQDPCCC